MPAYLAPVGNEQQSDANGAPLSGGLVYTYAAGTTTPIATYTDSSGLVAQANPIVLNSAGLPASPIWLPAGQAVKLVIQNASGVTQRTVDNVSGVNDPTNASTADQWVIFSAEPTYISATSFSLAGDQTNTFQVGRRIKSANTGGTAYSTITASSYDSGTGLTTVTVTNTSGSLDSGLSQVSYGLLSATNPSVPYLSGQVLQEVVYTDAGSTTTSSSLANVTASVKNITPKSSNSTLLIEVTFQAAVTAGGAGTNTQGTYQIFNNTAAANVGASYTQSVQSGTGSNMQSDGMGVARATVSNSALTTVGFTLRAKYSTVTAATVTATGQVWTIREIQN